jgi:hypothetical protein
MVRGVGPIGGIPPSYSNDQGHDIIITNYRALKQIHFSSLADLSNREVEENLAAIKYWMQGIDYGVSQTQLSPAEQQWYSDLKTSMDEQFGDYSRGGVSLQKLIDDANIDHLNNYTGWAHDSYLRDVEIFQGPSPSQRELSALQDYLNLSMTEISKEDFPGE